MTTRRWTSTLAIAVATTLPARAAPPATRPAATAKSVVYVCSRAKSMAAYMPFVRTEVPKSLGKLPADDPAVRFDVIFFGGPDGGRPVQLFDRLQPPTAVNVKRANEWVAKTAAAPTGGPPTLGPALAAAVALKPDLIYLLVDGVSDAAQSDAWVAAVTRAGGGAHGPSIVCLYLTDKPGDANATTAALRKLADASPGKFLPVAITGR